MGVNLKGRSFLTLMDFTPAEIRYLLDLAHELKAKKKSGIKGRTLEGKNIVLLFEKTSTRTRCSFEVAAMDEGAGVTFLDSKSSQMGKKETIADTARVLGRMFDGIEYRGYKQAVVEELARESGVPVWNGLTDVDHPTQILADIMTIEEHIDKPLNKVKVVFVGDVRNNMAYAWMYGCAKMGMKFAANEFWRALVFVPLISHVGISIVPSGWLFIVLLSCITSSSASTYGSSPFAILALYSRCADFCAFKYSSSIFSCPPSSSITCAGLFGVQIFVRHYVHLIREERHGEKRGDQIGRRLRIHDPVKPVEPWQDKEQRHQDHDLL